VGRVSIEPVSEFDRRLGRITQRLLEQDPVAGLDQTPGIAHVCIGPRCHYGGVRKPRFQQGFYAPERMNPVLLVGLQTLCDRLRRVFVRVHDRNERATGILFAQLLGV
jgi:hypothetical protein